MSGVQVRTQDHLMSKIRKKIEPLIEDEKLMLKSKGLTSSIEPENQSDAATAEQVPPASASLAAHGSVHPSALCTGLACRCSADAAWPSNGSALTHRNGAEFCAVPPCDAPMGSTAVV